VDRWHILVRSPDPQQLLPTVDTAAMCTHDIDPVDKL
jgi:hypothetical protein